MKKLIKKLLYKILNATESSARVDCFEFSQGLQNVSFEDKNAVLDRCNFAWKIKIGFATTLGYNWWDLSDAELEKIKPLIFKDFSKINDIYV